jgi:hypothetical protein
MGQLLTDTDFGGWELPGNEKFLELDSGDDGDDWQHIEHTKNRMCILKW